MCRADQRAIQPAMPTRAARRPGAASSGRAADFEVDAAAAETDPEALDAEAEAEATAEVFDPDAAAAVDEVVLFAASSARTEAEKVPVIELMVNLAEKAS